MSGTDEQPFLDDILARYADDAPRLVYADFLEESGDALDAARAKLVRVQLALARMPEDHPRRTELGDLQAELLTAHRESWTAHLAGFDALVSFRRGLADAVAVEASVFLHRGDELLHRGPIRRVRLLDAARLMPRLVHCPFLAAVRELDLCGCDIGNLGVDQLVRSPYLTATQVLDLGLNGLDDAGVRVLAKAATLPALRELSLNENEQITGEGVRFLAESPFFSGLTTLDLAGNDISDAGVRALVRSSAMARLRSLKLDRNHIGDAGVEALLGSGLLQRSLDRSPRLDLRANAITHVGAKLLAASSVLARVVHLDLGGNYLDDRGLAELLASPHLGQLRTLKLSRNQITDRGALALREVSERLFQQLRLLDLSGNRLTRPGLGILQAAVNGRAIALDLSGNVQAANGADVPVRTIPDDSPELRWRLWHPARRD